MISLPLLVGGMLCLCKLAWGCNEAVCASIVSKCMLTQSCKCEIKNSTCGRDCFYCLDYLYSECCSCVEMCPKPNETDSKLNQKSHVEELHEPIAELFTVLTEEKDRLLRWVSFTFPAHISFIALSNDKEIRITASPLGETDFSSILPTPEVNCTVAFMSQCMSWNKCKNSCRSMGASSYRWFHDGCCECVGSTCINYGINESKCLQCPIEKEEIVIDAGSVPEIGFSEGVTVSGAEDESESQKGNVVLEDTKEKDLNSLNHHLNAGGTIKESEVF